MRAIRNGERALTTQEERLLAQREFALPECESPTRDGPVPFQRSPNEPGGVTEASPGVGEDEVVVRAGIRLPAVCGPVVDCWTIHSRVLESAEALTQTKPVSPARYGTDEPLRVVPA